MTPKESLRDRSNSRKVWRYSEWWEPWFFYASVLVCVGFSVANALLYADHPHGRGLNLFATIWCALMAAWSLHNLVTTRNLR